MALPVLGNLHRTDGAISDGSLADGISQSGDMLTDRIHTLLVKVLEDLAVQWVHAELMG